MVAQWAPSVFGRASRSKQRPRGVLGLERLENRLTLAAELVAEINTVGGSSDPTGFTEFNGAVYFQAFDAEHGIELWRTDGTPQGTSLVKDFAPGPAPSFPGSLTVVGDSLYFTTGSIRRDDSAGWQPSVSAIWKTDGTEAGTQRLHEFSLPPASCYCRQFDLAEYNDQLYFIGQDADGRGLWRSDGTPEGTQLVKTIGGDGRASHLRDVRGNLFFYTRLYDRVENEDSQQMWTSDGTAEGTIPVNYLLALNQLHEINGVLVDGYHIDYPLDISPQPRKSMLRRIEWTAFPEQATITTLHDNSGEHVARIRDFVHWNGSLYYLDGEYSSELWKTDGTPEGTIMVRAFRELHPGGYMVPVPVEQLTATPAGLFFAVQHIATGYALWTSDGTEAGTALVADPRPDGDLTHLSNLTAVGDRLYFSMNDGQHGRELWTSDGTSSGTVLARDIRPGDASSRSDTFSGHPELGADDLFYLGNRVYFSATDGELGIELWSSDGSADGTVLVKDINNSSGGGSFPHGLIDIDGHLFFAASDGRRGFELWHSDGTTDGTAMIRDGIPGAESTFSYADQNLAGVNDPNDHVNYYYMDSVLTSNLAAAGAILGGRIYFLMPNLTTGRNELWRSDPQATVFETVASLHALPNVWLENATTIDGRMLFITYDYSLRGFALWKTDGTTGGTSVLRTFGSEPEWFTTLNNRVYFVGGQSSGDYDVWRTDGTVAGTTAAVFISSGAGGGGSYVGPLAVAGSDLYFSGTHSSSNWQIYRSNGTASGTSTLTTFQAPQWTIFTSGHVRPVADRVLFNVNWRIGGSVTVLRHELRASSGNRDDSVVLKEQIAGGWGGFYTHSIVDDDLYFSVPLGAIDFFPPTGFELWKTNGTPEGTGLVKPGISPCSSAPGNQCPTAVFNGQMYFPADDGIHGMELWRTDGTPEGTVMVQDINPGPRGSYPAHLLAVGETLYFAATDGNLGVELWRWTDTPLQPQAASPDLNRDGQINLVDLALLQQDLGMVRTGGGPLRRDLNLDGWVDRRDVALLLNAIRDSAPSSASPSAEVVRVGSSPAGRQPQNASRTNRLQVTQTRQPVPLAVDRAITADAPARESNPTLRSHRSRRGTDRPSAHAVPIDVAAPRPRVIS